MNRRGAKITYHDPFVQSINSPGLKVRRSALSDRAIAEADCVLLLTPHDSYDVAKLAEGAELLFDAQNALMAPGQHPNVVTL